MKRDREEEAIPFPVNGSDEGQVFIETLKKMCQSGAGQKNEKIFHDI